MNKQKVFVTRSRVPKAIKLLEENFDVSVWNSLIKAPKDDLKKYIKDADAILTEVDDVIDKEIISNAPNLKIISNRAIGVDNIDIETANINNIKIGNTPGVLHESCADLTFGLIIAITRQIPYAYNQVLKGNWKFFDQTPYIGPDVYGSTLGIIGFGKIGQKVAQRLQGWECELSYNDILKIPHEINEKFIVLLNSPAGILTEYCDVNIGVVEFTFISQNL